MKDELWVLRMSAAFGYGGGMSGYDVSACVVLMFGVRWH